MKQKEEQMEICENEPNAGILIYALQHLGYQNQVALCDIIDNAIDAGATIIQVKMEEDCIKIIDNGKGMTKEILNEALRLGSNIVREENTQLGKFGMGLSTASISIANITEVYTKAKQDQLLKSIVDVNVIRKTNQFVKLLEEATKEEENRFYEELQGEETGTIVILKDCYGLKQKNIKQFANTMKNEIGRVYRHFMGKIKFFVNEMKVEVQDPLYLDEKETQVFSDENYEVKWKEKDGIEKKANIHVKLVLLPNWSKAEMKERKINIPSQGFSVLRNSREIAFGYIPSGWLVKHNRYNRFRGEISFQSEIDEPMGVDFRKNGIDMVDSIKDNLERVLIPQIKTIANRAQQEIIKIENGQINHEEAEKSITKKSNLLIRPKQENKIEEKLLNEKSKVDVEFVSVASGRAGNIFSAYLKGHQTVIEWNIDHPFYERFVVMNKENKELVTAVDYLIYSIATSQLKVLGENEQKAEIIDQLISIMSNNMKALLN